MQWTIRHDDDVGYFIVQPGQRCEQYLRQLQQSPVAARRNIPDGREYRFEHGGDCTERGQFGVGDIDIADLPYTAAEFAKIVFEYDFAGS